jgi:dTDP-4-amino-4,6-dideoxygalactose transaminase
MATIVQDKRMTVPVMKPYLGEEEENALVEAVRSGWIAQGPKVMEFERAVTDYIGAKHGVAVSNCTTALHMALRLLNIGEGDEVIVPSFTFIATANSVLYCGGTPVFVDIDARTYNLDPNLIEQQITPRTKAILAVHQIGLAADMDAIYGIARKHNLAVIEDAACALGATYKSKRVGSLGRITCFSFHPRKAVTTGEGGMIVTDDDEFAAQARVMRTHGMSVSDIDRHRANRVIIEEYHVLGYNYRMSDLHAAVGIQQMKKLDYVLARRRELAARYNRAFADSDYIGTPYETSDAPHSYQSYMIQLLPGTHKSREQIMQALLEEGIATRRGIMAIHTEPLYRERFPNVSLPVTEEATARTMILPLYVQMTQDEQDYVIENVLRYVE